MEIEAIVLSVAGALALGGSNTLRRWILVKEMLTEGESRVVPFAIGGAVCTLWLLAGGSSPTALMPSLADARIFFGAVTATILVNLFIQFASIRSYALGEASLIAPIQALTPGLVVFAAMLFGEVPSTLGYIGIALIVVGTYIHAREGAGWRRYFEPLFVWALLRPYAELSNNERALRWAYLSALLGTIGLLCDSLMARHGDPVLGSMLWFWGLAILFSPVGRGKTKKELPPLRQRLRQHTIPILVQGVLWGLHYPLFATAFQLAPVSYIGSMKRLAIMVTVLLAAMYLGERATARRRIITASIIVAGAVCLALDPTQAKLTSSFVEFVRTL